MIKNDQHPEYIENLPYWNQIRTFVKGKKGVQAYIPNVTSDTSPDGVFRNKQYKDNAVYINFPARTLNAFKGSVFRKESQLELPSALQYLEDNADGAGMSLELVAKRTVSELIMVGRIGLLVSAPNQQAKITTYTAENIKNWQVCENGNLILVELITGKDEEKHLKLIDGVYNVEMYKDDELIESLQPTEFNGKALTYIPFIICGSTDNNPDVDDAPLWAIVDITRGHFKNSADLEDLASYMIPTPWVTVPNKQWKEEILGAGNYQFGNGAVVPVPEGGSAGLLQANENQMHSKLMEQKEDQLVKVGARLISKSATRTLGEAILENGAENSVLDNLVGNASDAIEKCLEWCGVFMNSVGNISFDLNREFFPQNIDPQLITAQILMIDRQIISESDMQDYLRKTGYLASDRTNEDIKNDINNSGNGLQ